VVDPEPIYVEGVTLVRIENGHYLPYLPEQLAIGFRLSDEECSTMEAFVEYARRCSKGAMMEKIGALQKQPGGRWAACRPGHDPVDITSGDLFRVEVDGEP
jgi:hypothetical protein